MGCVFELDVTQSLVEGTLTSLGQGSGEVRLAVLIHGTF